MLAPKSVTINVEINRKGPKGNRTWRLPAKSNGMPTRLPSDEAIKSINRLIAGPPNNIPITTPNLTSPPPIHCSLEITNIR